MISSCSIVSSEGTCGKVDDGSVQHDPTSISVVLIAMIILIIILRTSI